MIIRRKLYSSIYDEELGEERIYSQSEFLSEEDYLEEREFGVVKATNKAAKRAWMAKVGEAERRIDPRHEYIIQHKVKDPNELTTALNVNKGRKRNRLGEDWRSRNPLNQSINNKFAVKDKELVRNKTSGRLEKVRRDPNSEDYLSDLYFNKRKMLRGRKGKA